jgi:two-component system OmpR family sensor kinase
VLATIALTAAVSIAIGLVSVIALRVFLEQRLDSQLTSASRRSRSALERPINVSGVPPLLAAPRSGPTAPGFLSVPGQGQGTLGVLIDTNGVPSRSGFLDSAGRTQRLTSHQLLLLARVPADGQAHTVRLGGTVGSYRVVAQRTSSGLTAITGLPLSSVYAAIYQLSAVITAVSLLGLLAVAFIGGAIIRRTMRPLERVAATATEVSEMPLHRGEVALPVRVPDQDTDPTTEVGQVGAALNRLIGHVAGALAARQASEARVRRFVADASHELRTPLAAIRGYAELTRRSREELPPDVAHALNRVESEAIRMTGLVEELLLLARLDDGRPTAHEPVDLSRLLVDAISDAHAAGPDHRWQLALLEEPVVVSGDQPQLHQVVANLLTNARVHTPAGTTVVVGLSLDQNAAEAILRVSDDGPGISAELLPEVFERFARGDNSRSRGTGSTGLGLSIVAAVVAAHAGQVEVNSVPGSTRFDVHLPLHDPSHDAQHDPDQVAASTSNATSSRSEENVRTALSTESATALAN